MRGHASLPAAGPLAGLSLAVALSVSVGRAAALDVPLVVTQWPVKSRTPQAVQRNDVLAGPLSLEGARLVVVSPDGQVRVLSEGFESACDPNVSFDGQRVLFAGRREPGARWRIWEIGLQGQGTRAVSPEHLDARQPIHVSTLFTLDSPEPWYTTVFVGLDPAVNEAGRPGGANLYDVKLDGTEVRRLTFNPNANVDPFQMWDGRVLYAAERHPNQPGGSPPHVGLYAIHVEGADMEFYGGERGQRIQRTPCATGSGQIVFIESGTVAPDGSGQLACVEEQRPHVTYRRITTDPAFVYRQPAPLAGSRIVVSRRPARGRANWGVVAFDTSRATCEPVFDTPDFHEVQAVAAVPRSRPDGHSTVVETRFDTGIFYGLNCYDADPRLAPHLPPGTVKRVRFVEGVPAAAPTLKNKAKPHREPPFVARRLVGEAPVEPDGSFNVEVPVDIPLLVQTLDERGLALATCGWVWVKPREKRGCIGCHEDPERIPENQYVLALQRPSNRLVLPPEQRRAVTFRQDVAPILQTHCATDACHGNRRNELHLPLAAPQPAEADYRKAFERLLRPARHAVSPAPAEGKYVDAGRARTSALVWHLAGTNTARPWDLGSPKANPGPIAPMPPPGHGVPLSPEQFHTIVQWIDLGAAYAPPALAAQPTPPLPKP